MNDIRENGYNLDCALEEVKTLRLNYAASPEDEGFHVSVGMLNCILSGAAERGDIDRTIFILEGEFPRNNLNPNADSFSFAMETLGKHISRRTRNPAGPELMASCLDQATEFLNMMEENGIAPTQHIIRDYLELLCRANEVDTATEIILEELSTSSTSPIVLVSTKAVHCVAMANAKLGNFEIAREIAALASTTNTDETALPFLSESITKEEQRQRHRQRLMSRKGRRDINLYE